MKTQRKNSRRFLAFRFFMDAFMDGVRAVLRRIITIGGILVTVSLVFGASQIVEHVRHKAPPSSPVISDSDESATAAEDASRGPASIENEGIVSTTETSRHGNGLNQESQSPSNNPSAYNDLPTSPGGFSSNTPLYGSGGPSSAPAYANSGVSSGGYSPTTTGQSQSQNGNSATSGNSANGNSQDIIGGGGGGPQTSPPIPTGTSGDTTVISNGSPPSGTVETGIPAAILSASGFGLNSGGGISTSPNLMIQAQIGEVASTNVQTGTAVLVVSGFTGTLY